jgi:hypothetical protein
MRCDVVVKTWMNDLCWTAYCLQFLNRNWREPDSNIILIANEDCEPVIKTWGIQNLRPFYLRPWGDTYNFHMYATMLIDDFTDADIVAIYDSDIMLVEPTRASDLLENDKPIIYTRDAERLHRSNADEVHHDIWFPVTESFLGVQQTKSYMQAFPFTYRTDLFRKVRNLITLRTGKGVMESLHAPGRFHTANFLTHKFTFCDYEVLGMYAHLHEPSRYVFKEAPEWPPTRTKHYHSWSQWNDQTRAELDAMLKSQ